MGSRRRRCSAGEGTYRQVPREEEREEEEKKKRGREEEKRKKRREEEEKRRNKRRREEEEKKKLRDERNDGERIAIEVKPLYHLHIAVLQ